MNKKRRMRDALNSTQMNLHLYTRGSFEASLSCYVLYPTGKREEEEAVKRDYEWQQEKRLFFSLPGQVDEKSQGCSSCSAHFFSSFSS